MLIEELFCQLHVEFFSYILHLLFLFYPIFSCVDSDSQHCFPSVLSLYPSSPYILLLLISFFSLYPSSPYIPLLLISVLPLLPPPHTASLHSPFFSFCPPSLLLLFSFSPPSLLLFSSPPAFPSSLPILLLLLVSSFPLLLLQLMHPLPPYTPLGLYG